MIDTASSVESAAVPSATSSGTSKAAFSALRAIVQYLYERLAALPKLGPFSKLLDLYKTISTEQLTAIETAASISAELETVVGRARQYEREISAISESVQEDLANAPSRLAALELVIGGLFLDPTELERYKKKLENATQLHRQLLGERLSSLRHERDASNELRSQVFADLEKLPVRAEELLKDNKLEPIVVANLKLRVEESREQIERIFSRLQSRLQSLQRSVHEALR